MKIWLRTLNSLSAKMDICSTAVEMVFYHLYAAMKNLNLPVVLEDPHERCVELWHGWDFQPKGGNINIVITTGGHEITRWVRWQEIDCIFVSSQQGMNIIGDCSKPVYIWHHRAVDPEIFHVLERADEPFIFVHSVFPQEHKGSNMLCKVFNETFGGIDNAFLYINHPRSTQYGLLEFIDKYKSGKIIFTAQTYNSRKEAWKLYNGNCYVYPTLLDSAANTVCEALSTGIPAIVSDIPLFRELLDDDCVWWIEMNSDVGRHGCGSPSIASIREQMLYAYEHRLEARQKGKYGAQFIRAKYTWEGCIIREFLPIMREKGYL